MLMTPGMERVDRDILRIEFLRQNPRHIDVGQLARAVGGHSVVPRTSVQIVEIDAAASVDHGAHDDDSCRRVSAEHGNQTLRQEHRREMIDGEREFVAIAGLEADGVS